jgi:hypothetical protein
VTMVISSKQVEEKVYDVAKISNSPKYFKELRTIISLRVGQSRTQLLPSTCRCTSTATPAPVPNSCRLLRCEAIHTHTCMHHQAIKELKYSVTDEKYNESPCLYQRLCCFIVRRGKLRIRYLKTTTTLAKRENFI